MSRIPQDQGFTLLELLVTMIVLGVLSTIAVLSLGTSRQSSVQQSCKTAHQGIVLAIASYQSDHAGSLPSSLTAMTTADAITGVSYLSADLLPTVAKNGYVLTLDQASAAALSAPSKYLITVGNSAGTLGTAPAACDQVS